MRLSELRDVYRGQDIYIVGTGPSTNIFPFEFLQGKICLSLNDAYKMHPAITPIALMHHEVYAHTDKQDPSSFHPYFQNIKYPIVKGSSRKKKEVVDWDNPRYYYYDWSLDIRDIWSMTKRTEYLYYTPEGCSLHAALQIAWILGAVNIFVIGCDSREIGGKHYALYDKNGIRDNQKLKGGVERNYDSYVEGTLIVQEFLRRKGVRVFNLSSMVGYHLIDLQYDFLSGEVPVDDLISKAEALRAKVGL